MVKRIVWFLPLFMLFYCGCGVLDATVNAERVRGSGNVIQQNRDVHGFHGVSFAGSGELSIRQGNEESLIVEADENILPYIRTDVEEGRLFIGFRRGVSVSTSSPIRFTLMVRELDELDLSGSGKIRTGPVRGEDFRIHLSGSGEIRMDTLDAATLKADISGSGDMELPGKVDRQEIHISGSGRFHAPDLDSQSADITVSGSGDATLRARTSLSARISGSGSVEYYGNPSVTKKVSGSGSVRHLGDR
jgi:carbon monoxide dehydrogenase subunit G